MATKKAAPKTAPKAAAKPATKGKKFDLRGPSGPLTGNFDLNTQSGTLIIEYFPTDTNNPIMIGGAAKTMTVKFARASNGKMRLTLTE